MVLGRHDPANQARKLRDSVGVCPSADTAPGGIPSAGILCLDLSDNRLSDATAVALASALTHDGWVQALNLRGNLIGLAGASALTEMLVTNRYVRCVNLDGNGPLLRHPKGPTGSEMLKAIMATRHEAHVKASRRRPKDQKLSDEVSALVELWSSRSGGDELLEGAVGDAAAEVAAPMARNATVTTLKAAAKLGAAKGEATKAGDRLLAELTTAGLVRASVSESIGVRKAMGG